MTLLAIYVLLALGVSFTCSILEAVLLSVTPAHVAVLEKQQHPAARQLRALKEEIDRPLAAILSLNTIAHTVGAAGAGAQAAKVFGSASLGIFSAVLTFLILVTSEIIPKTLGAVHWKRLAPLAVRVLRVMVILMWPLVKMAEWLTDLLSPGQKEAAVSREEIAAMAEEGQKEGVVEEGESRVLNNLLRLSVLRVGDIMTPGDHMVSLPEEMEVREVVEQYPELKFSRLPLHAGENGQRRYTGYALKDDILTQAARDEHGTAMTTLRRELLTVQESLPLPTVFDQMVGRREHVALAMDDKGEMTGLITMEDIIETLLGLEIFDEGDNTERIHKRARAHWRKRALRLGLISDVSDERATLGITGGEPPNLFTSLASPEPALSAHSAGHSSSDTPSAAT